MTQLIERPWEAKKTDETRHIERLLRAEGFPDVEAYRYNSASIRIRVVDPRFEGLSDEQRDGMVEPILARLDERTQGDILLLLTMAPSELPDDGAGGPGRRDVRRLRKLMLNEEFVNWSPSGL